MAAVIPRLAGAMPCSGQKWRSQDGTLGWTVSTVTAWHDCYGIPSRIISNCSVVAGIALRVPTPNVSVVDLVIQVEKKTLAEEVNEAFRQAAANEMKGILAVSDVPLVSRDFALTDVSTTIDSSLTMVMVSTAVSPSTVQPSLPQLRYAHGPVIGCQTAAVADDCSTIRVRRPFTQLRHVNVHHLDDSSLPLRHGSCTIFSGGVLFYWQHICGA